ncbi:MAG: translation initiation factor IF-3 [Parcubacteria group bacterium Licking1014_17]|nr:MAG: translation initiation factor IF-3 [Parcubacteria group bacterium Licking1014_17]
MQKQYTQRFEQRPRLNHQIKAPEVRVIGPEGENLGVLDIQTALRAAEDRGLDLVEINATVKPPLAKIVDYNKYLYMKEKRERESKAKQSKGHAGEMKEIQVGYKTDTHDLGIKAKQADKFLAKGYRIKIVLRLRGREKTMVNIGKQKLEGFTKLISLIYTVETPIKAFPGGVSILIKPGK